MPHRPLTPNEKRLWRYVAERGFRASTEIDAKSTAQRPTRGGRFDAAILKKIAEGEIALSGKIDLHGDTLDRAYERLQFYLQDMQTQGALYVLVVTGKGKIDIEHLPDDHRGTLRQMVPRWLAAAPFIELVADVATAHIRHGGEGALYVRLRRT